MLLPSLVVALLLSALLWSCATATGLGLLRLLSGWEDDLERLALGATLGWALLGALWFLIAWAGGFTLPVVGAVLMAGTLTGGSDLRRLLPRVLGRCEVVDLIWLLPAVPMLLLALLPPHGFDALNYHLPFARAFADSGALLRQPTLRFEVFPAIGELWQAVALLFGDALAAVWEPTAASWCGPQAAKGLALGATLCTGLWLALWARSLAGAVLDDGAGVRRWIPRLAFALWLSHPLVIWLSGQAYIESSVALFVVAALYTVQRSPRSAEAAVLAGLLAGTAAALKYLGVMAVGLAGLWILLAVLDRALSAPDRREVHFSGVRLPGRLVLFGLAAVAMAGPTYLRLMLETGSPVYPFFQADPSGGDQVWSVQLLGERLLWWVRLPWSVVFDREAFDLAAPLTPWTMPLFILTVVVVARQLRGRLAGASAVAAPLVAAVLYAGSLVVHDDPRLHHLLPSTALLCGPMAVVLGWLAGRRLRIWGPVLSLALLLPAGGYGAYKLFDVGGVPLTEAQRRAWLGERLPGYGLLQRLGEVCGDVSPRASSDGPRQRTCTVYLFGRSRLRWYAPEGVVPIGDALGRYRTSLLARSRGRPDHVRQLLVEQWDVDYLLMRRRGADRFQRRLGTAAERIGEEDGTVLLQVGDQR